MKRQQWFFENWDLTLESDFKEAGFRLWNGCYKNHFPFLKTMFSISIFWNGNRHLQHRFFSKWELMLVIRLLLTGKRRCQRLFLTQLNFPASQPLDAQQRFPSTARCYVDIRYARNRWSISPWRPLYKWFVAMHSPSLSLSLSEISHSLSPSTFTISTKVKDVYRVAW